jgi:hypothetical protein
MNNVRLLVAASIVVAGCHSHGSAGHGDDDEDGPSMSAVRARITSQVRENALENRLADGSRECRAIRWSDGRPICARDDADMRTVTLRAGETAYYCPEDGFYWYLKDGAWLGPFQSGLRKQ